MKPRLTFALLSAGFTSMAAQIVLMRELLIVFYGNELSFAIALAAWLFWTGFGSFYTGKHLVPKLKDKAAIFALSQIILAFFLPLSVLAARVIPRALNFSPGEIISILPMALTSFILLVPFSILGFLFVAGCAIYKTGGEKNPGRYEAAGASGIGYVYIFEAAGAAAGGFLTSLFLIRYLTPLDIMFLIAFLNLSAAFLLISKRKAPAFFTGLIIAGFLLFIFAGGADSLRNYSLGVRWSGHKLLTSENSVYGNVALTKRENIYSVFTNGLYAFTVPDELTSEMNAHFPLLEHPSPRDVLLIGGGSSGQLKEVLKHPVRRVDYVELDPLIIGLAKSCLPAAEALDDPRVDVITDMDGRLFIKRTDRKYDVVIINLPEPYTAQLNRFYTVEFYNEVKGVLRDNGIVSFSLHSNPNYISPEQARLYLSLRATLKEVFADVKITPGEMNHFLASGRGNLLTLDWRVLMDRLRERNIDAKYMREYYLYSGLSPERIDSFRGRLAGEKDYRPNRDFRPIAYYYDMVLWGTYFKYNLKGFFGAINPKKIYAGFTFLYIAALIPVSIRRINRKIPDWAVLTCVGTTGFSEMAFQIITLLSFQIMYGYVYYKSGIILTSYMAGLILGGWFITRRLAKVGNGYNLFVKTQAAIFIYPLILPALFAVFSGLKGDISFRLGSNVIFPYLPVIPGIIGGFQFPLANKLCLKSAEAKEARPAALTYGIDLFGSCLGGLLVAALLIPIVGIYMSCFLTAGLNLAGLALLLLNGWRNPVRENS